ncbi:MAG: hypothetical protein HC915_17695 [Anaerolineae bacterium]|nr:hypothetical protein [Anaerolineae bacterium]
MCVNGLVALMVLLFFVGDGLAWLGPILITTGIYIYTANKSALVKQHARQALAAQLIASLGWLLLLVLGFSAWGVALIFALVLVLVLVGLVLTPMVILALPFF